MTNKIAKGALTGARFLCPTKRKSIVLIVFLANSSGPEENELSSSVPLQGIWFWKDCFGVTTYTVY